MPTQSELADHHPTSTTTVPAVTMPSISHQKQPPPVEYNIPTPRIKRFAMTEAQQVPVELGEYIEKDVALLH